MPKSITLSVESVRLHMSIQAVRIGRYRAQDNTSVSRTDLESLLGDVPRRRYCVTYSLVENGDYLVNVNTTPFARDHVYLTDNRLRSPSPASSACILPKSWRGKMVRRKVHPEGHCKWCRKEVA